VLYSTLPGKGGVEAMESIEAHLDALKDIPTIYFVAGVEHLSKLWGADQFGAPQPGDIRQAARRIYRQTAERGKVTKLLAERARDREGHFGGESAREWLNSPAGQPELHPDRDNAFSMYAGARRIAGLGPLMNPSDEATRKERRSAD